MKTLIPLLVLTASAHAATVYSIDINDADNSLTEAGWVGLNSTHTTSSAGGSVIDGGIEFSISSSDGARLRGTVGSPNPDALYGDFAFDEGAQSVAIIFHFGGAGDLAAGVWQVEVWSYDSNNPSSVGDQIVALRTNGTNANPATINGALQANGTVTSTMAISATGPSETFTFLSDGTSTYDFFLRENSAGNKTRLNAVRLTAIPEPSSAALLGLGGLALLARKKR